MFDRFSAPVLIRVILPDGSFRERRPGDVTDDHGRLISERKVVTTKLGNPVYKFSKQTGRNCGLLFVGEKRNRSRYEYNDEL